MKKVILIGYSGHAYVVAEVLQLNSYSVVGYCDKKQNDKNKLGIKYFGCESNLDVIRQIKDYNVFPSIGDNIIREKVMIYLDKNNLRLINAVHPDSSISKNVEFGKGVLISSGVRINPFVTIGDGTIVNTGSVVEHECILGKFTHIAPGAILAGNIEIGDKSFIGANSVIKQGIKIGSNVIIGAGSVVIRDIPDNSIYAGNPAKPLNK